MRIHHPIVVALLALLSCNITAEAQTAADHLKAASAPAFRVGHTLLPLSRWGHSMSFETTVELCERWGYALEFGRYATMEAAEAAHDPTTRQGKVCALTRSDPKRYPLFVIPHRPLNRKIKEADLPESYWLHDADGKRLEGPAWKRRNPEVGDEFLATVADKAVAPLKKIREICPISVVLEGGEWGLTELGHARSYLKQDPSVVKAKGEMSWWDYYSKQKARWVMPTTQAIRDALPERDVLVWYHFGGMPRWTDDEWAWNYDYLRPVADMPGQSLYYMHFNSGWTGEGDMLTRFLCSVAKAKTYGDPLSYNWLCAGWKEGKFSDMDRYMGFLKCLYTAGQVGGVAGYFSYPRPRFTEDLGPEIPHWLEQMMVLGRAHALFSHVEDLIRDGKLLEGSGHNRVAKEVLEMELPAYEFPTDDPNVRVLARKHNKRGEWLVTAWAADGPARKATVFIDEVGKLKLNARPAGSVYRVKATIPTKHEPPVVELELLDEDPMYPTARWAKKTR
jgi:hypothetical protein